MKGAVITLVLAILGISGCDGFTDLEEGGWWCEWDSTGYSHNSMDCDIAWDCENRDPVHLGAKDDPDPLLRIYSYRISCSTLMEGSVDKGYSCACYEEKRHLTTFIDQEVCLIAVEGGRGWFRDVVGLAKRNCGWAPLPR